ncbi:uncharacterized mitochondrial protein AtMg01250-like [Helianthus annuus]|uniref:uncharacterized mitochondrial protein AtMg01250-like n=1 Tax=Helianthus annuus TaxID=4232 RepID=UPI000B8F68C8|nr:uncharacterized mitochondrial protein AtMg01250-like [Helianthus annuus]
MEVLDDGALFNESSAMVVNDSPTKDFGLERGLRQGDPLSTFLFIIAMEALNVMMTKAVNLCIFNTISLPNGILMISHLFYADDVMFVGEPSIANLKNLNRILRVFYLVSRLKVNFPKVNCMGVAIDEEDLLLAVDMIHCKMGKFLLEYLGWVIGANMNKG